MSDESKTTNQGEGDFADPVAQSTGAGIATGEQAQSESEAQLASELAAMRQLHELVTRLLVTSDLRTALDEILIASLELAGTQMGSVHLFNRATDALEIVAQRGLNQQFLNSTRNVWHNDESVFNKAMLEQQRVVIEDVQTDPDYESHRESAASAGYRGAQFTPLLSHDGELLGMLSTFYPKPRHPPERELRMLDLYTRQAADFVERVRSNEALAASEAKYRTLFNAIDQGFFLAEVIFDEHNRPVDVFYIDANPAAIRMVGRDYRGLRLREIDPNFEAYWYEIFGRVAQMGVNERLELYAAPLNTWFNFYVFKPDAGNNHRIAVTFLDITETKRVEAALRASEEQLRLILESVQDYAIFALDAEGKVISWNEGARRLKGYTAEEIIGQPVHCFYLPEDVAAGKIEQEMQLAFTTGRSEDESWRVRKDGSRFWVNEIMTPRFASDGTLLGFTKISRDLSRRKAAEEALRASEERLRVTLESITDYAIITLDPDGHITGWNTGAEQMFGYTAAEALGQPTAIIFTPEDRTHDADVHEMELARRTGRAEDERWHLHKDGTRFYVSGVLVPIQESGITGYVKVARDLTKRKRMEEALERRVEERTLQVRNLVTQLTMSEQEERRRISNILHDDLQQRLYSLNFQLNILRDILGGNEPEAAQQTLDEIEQALVTSIQIARELSVDLSPPVLHNEGLLEALRWLAKQMKQQHGLAVEVQAEGIHRLLDENLRVLLFQTVRELLFNVVKHARVNSAVVSLTSTEKQVRIEVIDQGLGYDVAQTNQTSQGLLRIEQRLQLLGGHMEIASAPGQGTRVMLHIPLQYPPA